MVRDSSLAPDTRNEVVGATTTTENSEDRGQGFGVFGLTDDDATILNLELEPCPGTYSELIPKGLGDRYLTAT